MAFMNVKVEHNNTDISDILVAYSRTQEICTGIGNIDMQVVDSGRSFDVWDTLEVYEDDDKKATYYISSVVHNERDGSLSLTGQDGSKKLTDYFIADSYTIDYYSTSGGWIEQFLTEAKVSYSSIGVGVPLSENTQLGLSSAYDTIQTLLQYSGWYMYFNANNSAVIGELAIRSGSATKITDSKILNVSTAKHDKMLRNRAVVWGNYDEESESQIISDISVRTPWNYDAKDLRAVVISNHNIRLQSDADAMARQLLNEFSKINFEVTVKVAGSLNVNLGGFVSISSMGYKGKGMITTITVEFSNGGLTTTLILNQRCPRLFAFWGEVYDYVYVGTESNGVWRKPFENGNWESFSTGLPSGIGVTDLIINNDIFGMVTASGEFYHREIDTSWTLYSPSGIIDDEEISYDNLYAKAVSINHETGNLLIGYNSDPDDLGKSWVMDFSMSGISPTFDQIYIGEDNYSCNVVDLENDGVENIVSVSTEGLVGIINLGIRTNSFPLEQIDSVIIMPESDNIEVFQNTEIAQKDYAIGAGNLSGTGWCIPIVQSFNENRIYSYMAALNSGSTTTHTFRRTKYDINWTGSEWEVNITNTDATLSSTGFVALRNEKFLYKDNINDNIIYSLVADSGASGYTTTFYRISVNFATTTVTKDTSQTYDFTGKTPFVGSLWDGALQKEEYVWKLFYSISGNQLSVYYWKFNQLTGLLSSGTAGTITVSGRTNVYFLDGEFSINREGTDIYFVINYRGDNDELGFMYGTSSSINKSSQWTRPGGNTDSLYLEDSHSFFAGDAQSTSYLVFQIRYSLHSGAVGISYTYAGIIRGCVSSSLLTYTDNDSINTTDTNTAKEFLHNDEKAINTYNDYISHLYGENTGGWSPVSSKYLSTAYYLQHYTVPDSDPLIEGIRVVSLPYFLETIAFDLDSEGYNVRPVGTGLQNHDDFSEKLYVYLHNSEYQEHFGCVDIDGNLIHAYPNIGSTSFICVANGFVIGSNKSVYFLWPNDGYKYYSLAISNILKHKDHSFDFLATVSGLYQVEISKGSPTEVYEITPSGAASLPILQSYSNEVDDFSVIDTEHNIYDARVFDFNTPSGIAVASGDIGDNWRYCGIATDDGIRAFPTTLSGSSLLIINLSGARHLETTNYTDNPYFFISTDIENVASGILASGRFYQRDPDSSYLVDYSSGLPNSAITIIRTDDLI